MNIVEINKHNIKYYHQLTQKIYKNCNAYRDTATHLFESFLYKRDPFAERAQIMPIMVLEDDEPLLSCMLITANQYEDTLQIAFLEFVEHGAKALEFLINYARELATKNAQHNIVIGMDGHVNYGLGILASHYDKNLSFGNKYNHAYYVEHLRQHADEIHKLVSYRGELASYNLDKYQRVFNKLYKRYHFRFMNYADFKADMAIYTSLNNIIFKKHPLYFERQEDEDYALFKDLKLFLKPENLIFAYDGDEPIGFLLWYPDFNQLIKSEKSPNAMTVLKNKLFSERIDTFKIVEIGVKPKYGGRGVIIALFNECLKCTRDRYQYYETSWIFDENFRSSNLGKKWAEAHYKNYEVYEIKLDVTSC